MNVDWLRGLLRDQQGSGFRDFAGAEAAATLPVSDRLLTSLVAARLPRSAPIRDLDLRADGDNLFSVRVKLASPSFLPAFTIRFAVVGQPRLPDVPVLTCRMLTQGIGPFMGPLLRLFAKLPPWVRVEQDLLSINLRLLASEFGVPEVLTFVTDLQLGTMPGRFVLSLKAALPGGRPADRT